VVPGASVSVLNSGTRERRGHQGDARNGHDFAPRFGLAYRPFGGDKTVVRASYGVFYNVNMWNNFQVMDVNPPFLISINQLNTPGNPVVTMANANQTATLSCTNKPEVLVVPQDYGLA